MADKDVVNTNNSGYWAIRPIVSYRIGAEHWNVRSIVPVGANESDATSFANALKILANSNYKPFDPVSTARTYARSVYLQFGIPAGGPRWVWDEATNTAELFPTSEVGEGVVPNARQWTGPHRHLIEESDLWAKCGAKEGSAAWMAGQVLRYAENVARVRHLLNCQRYTGDYSVPVFSVSMLSHSLCAETFKLTRSYDALIALFEPQNAAGRSAVDVIEKGLAQGRGQRGRRGRWESRFLPSAIEFCAGKTNVSWAELARSAERWDRDEVINGRISGLPKGDKAINAGIRRMWKSGELDVPGKVRPRPPPLKP